MLSEVGWSLREEELGMRQGVVLGVPAWAGGMGPGPGGPGTTMLTTRCLPDITCRARRCRIGAAASHWGMSCCSR